MVDPFDTISSAHRFLHREVIEAEELRRRLQGCMTVGFSGYTKPPEDSDYEEVAREVVSHVLAICAQRWGKNLAVVYGSSDAGIDRIVEQVCQIAPGHPPLLGVTCPEFAPWVPDRSDLPPLVFCASRAEYAALFIEMLSWLVITGGREHTIRFDLMALALGKQIAVYNCAPSPHHNFVGGRITNAAGLLCDNLHFAQAKEELTAILSSIADVTPIPRQS
jgi:hypothetical protein